MKIFPSTANFLLLIFALMSTPVAFGSVHVAYFTSWSIYARKFTPSEIPANSISMLNYAFAKVANNRIALTDSWADIEKPWPGDKETQPFKGNFWQINHVLKAKHPHLKTLISVGGWTMSNNFSPMAATEESRNTFAESCAEFINKYGFDGVDIDWEYPVAGGQDGNMRSPSDKENFTLLLKKIREKIGEKKLLTASISANPEYLGNLQLKEIGQILDYLNLMTYDFAGAWDSRTGHQTNTFSTSSSKFSVDLAAKTMLQGGVPKQKIVIGTPMYGRAFANAGATNNGLSQPFSGAAPGTIESGVLNFYDVQSKIKTGDLVRYEDPEAKAIWGYSTKSKLFVTYEDTDSIKYKTDYVISNGFGGIMSWELSQEGPDAPLSNAIARALKLSHTAPSDDAAVVSKTLQTQSTQVATSSIESAGPKVVYVTVPVIVRVPKATSAPEPEYYDYE